MGLVSWMPFLEVLLALLSDMSVTGGGSCIRRVRSLMGLPFLNRLVTSAILSFHDVLNSCVIPSTYVKALKMWWVYGNGCRSDVLGNGCTQFRQMALTRHLKGENKLEDFKLPKKGTNAHTVKKNVENKIDAPA